MANYDDFRKMAREAIDTIADVSVEAYKLAEEKARVFAKKAKLNAGIANERALIRRLKVEIGGTYYKLHKDEPEEALKLHCEDITTALDRIAAKQRELEELKNVSTFEEEAEEDIEADVETEAECCDDSATEGEASGKKGSK